MSVETLPLRNMNERDALLVTDMCAKAADGAGRSIKEALSLVMMGLEEEGPNGKSTAVLMIPWTAMIVSASLFSEVLNATAQRELTVQEVFALGVLNWEDLGEDVLKLIPEAKEVAALIGKSTLGRGDLIEKAFYRLVAQERAISFEEAKALVEKRMRK